MAAENVLDSVSFNKTVVELVETFFLKALGYKTANVEVLDLRPRCNTVNLRCSLEPCSSPAAASSAVNCMLNFFRVCFEWPDLITDDEVPSGKQLLACVNYLTNHFGCTRFYREPDSAGLVSEPREGRRAPPPTDDDATLRAAQVSPRQHLGPSSFWFHHVPE